MGVALELTGPAAALLDEPLALRVRGAGPDAEVVWRARVRDDDGRVWRASAASAEELDAGWTPAKTPAAPCAALESLRPVQVDVRAELADGRAASRTVARVLLGDGVKVRRWRGDLVASLFLPAAAPVATVLVVDAPAPAVALLASRGVLVLNLRDAGAAELAAERLAAVPGATSPRRLDALPGPPGLPGPPYDPGAWDALLAELGAAARATPRPGPATGTSRR